MVSRLTLSLRRANGKIQIRGTSISEWPLDILRPITVTVTDDTVVENNTYSNVNSNTNANADLERDAHLRTPSSGLSPV
ncbi:hypothetical protein D9758_015853 [Tetrapyrgos nigripes]|uniref:Uncharacterized protein n=1 Tax=Tetrapyrgos nigripes TaxID=182062 RepID=A0A8H5C7X8_9AGAR|nr:hypothetical protein D9758_015853 [Tetrapyrgos nigripes]